MTRPIILSALILLCVGSPSAAYAASCNSFTSVSSSLWDKYGFYARAVGCGAAQFAGVPIWECLKVTGQVERVTRDMISFFNKQAGNSWAKIGPRRLDFGKKLQGTLQSTGGRMFISAAPTTARELEVVVTKRDGKAKASVVVCTTDSRKKRAKRWEITIPKDAKNGRTFRKKISGVTGRIVSVHLDSKNLIRSFSYSVRVKELRQAEPSEKAKRAARRKR